MEKIEFTSPIKNGHLLPSVRIGIKKAMEGMEGKRIRVKIEEARKQRSLPQNKFWFAAIVPAVRDFYAEGGQMLSLEETHDMLVKRVWKHTKFVQMPDGEMVEVRRSSTDRDTINWEEKVEQTRAYYAPFGLQLPYPHENILV